MRDTSTRPPPETPISTIRPEYRAYLKARLRRHRRRVRINGRWHWFWTGPKLKSGYGVTNVQRHLWTRPPRYTSTYIHRLAYLLYHGPIPAGYWVQHACDQPLCWHPKCLSADVPSQNSIDIVRRKRRVYKLVLEEALEIRAALRLGVPQTTLAARYHVSRYAINDIARYRTWFWIDNTTKGTIN